MKKTFHILGILTLLIGSFIYSEKVGIVSKLNDDLLIEIKEKQNNYIQKQTEAIIKNNTIIPGKNGQEIDIKQTYNKMKQIGYFEEKLLVYKTLEVKQKLKDNKDKYIISANKNEKKLSLIFKITNTTNIEKIISTLNKTSTKATFFIDSTFLENNKSLIINLIKNGHTIGNLSNKEDYTSPDFIQINSVITQIGNQKNNYCYTEKKNQTILKSCARQNSYTIIPTKVIKEKPYINIKKEIKKGAIISLEPSQELEMQLENIINYINSKGYQINSLEKVLEE